MSTPVEPKIAKPTAAPATPAVTAAPAPPERKLSPIINFAYLADGRHPRSARDAVEQRPSAGRLVYDSLLAWDATGTKLVPQLAAEWKRIDANTG